MDHPRFVSGDISTAFIAEEYRGFYRRDPGEAEIIRIAASAAADASRGGNPETAHASPGGWTITNAMSANIDWSGRRTEFPVRITADRQGSTVEIASRNLRGKRPDGRGKALRS